MARLKAGRVDYSSDINHIDGGKSVEVLNRLFHVEELHRNEILYPLFNLIVKVQDNSSKGGKFARAHEEMGDLLKEFWDSRTVMDDVKYESNKEISKILRKSLIHLDHKDFRSFLASILRIPEYYYISHEELSEIQSNPLLYLDEVSMLSTNKSIFKKPNKSAELSEIVHMNRSEIREYCGRYDEDMANKFKEYLHGENFANKEVASFMKRWKRHMGIEFEKVVSREKIVFCQKASSSFYRGSRSILEDNFWCYKSNIVEPRIEEIFHQYDRIPLEGNYDFLRLAFGLGPDFKLRNVVFTNAMLQNIGSIVRDASKKAFMEQEEQYYSPVRTDSQLDKFHAYLSKPKNGFKICFDLSKYSDYLISQMLDELIDYITPDHEYGETLKRIQKLPIRIDGKEIEIVFGTGAGVKSNFDLITALNMLMIDFTAYRTGLVYDELQVVGDDLFLVCYDEKFYRELIVTYTHFNCKVNIKKAKVVKDNGKISFCGRHFWLEGDEATSWNGLPPGLWMKEIYSMNRLQAIARILIETNQTYDLDRMEDLFNLVKPSIDREFRYNNMAPKPEDVFKDMLLIPYDINGLNAVNGFVYGENEEWAEKVYNTLDNYIFMMKNNSRVKEMMSKYYDMFPDHPIIESFQFSNGKYLEIIQKIQATYEAFRREGDEESYLMFKRWIKRAITEFGKFDQGSMRISTKDRTSDYFNEDLFWKDPMEHVKEYVHRFDQLEIDVINSFETDLPIAEMYMVMMSKRLIRNSYSWTYDGYYMDLPSGKVARFVTADSRSRNGKYYDYFLVLDEIFDHIYPDNEEEYGFKAAAVRELARFLKDLWKRGRRQADDLMGMFET